MEELNEIISRFPKDEGIRYFYHFTSASGEQIMEEGLIVANPSWTQSFLEFTEEELDDVESVLNENKKTKLKQNNTMVIAAIYEDEIDGLIRPLGDAASRYVDWEGVAAASYIVEPQYILGYVDLDTLEIVMNDFANVGLSVYRGY